MSNNLPEITTSSARAQTSFRTPVSGKCFTKSDLLDQELIFLQVLHGNFTFFNIFS